jgi:outer membrane protein assembly factor BamB
VYAIETATGKPRWEYPAGRGASSDVLRSGNRIFFVTMSDTLVCLELGDGQRRWSFGTGSGGGDEITNALAASETRVWFAGLDGAIHAFDVESGRELWRRELGSNAGSLALLGDDLFLSTEDGRLLRMSGKEGAVLGESRTMVSAFQRPPAPAGDSLIVFHGGQLIGCVDRSLRLRWQKLPPDSWMTSRAYVWGGLVLAADESGLLYAFNVDDGSVVWTRRAGKAVRGLRTTPSAFYAGTVKGMVYAIKPPGKDRE